MRAIRMLLPGLVSLCLLLSLSSCGASKEGSIRTEIREVAVPVIVDVPEGLTAQVPEPQLPANTGEARAAGGSSCPPDAPPHELGTCVLADYIDALRAWGRLGWCRVERIGNLGPGEDRAEACPKTE